GAALRRLVQGGPQAMVRAPLAPGLEVAAGAASGVAAGTRWAPRRHSWIRPSPNPVAIRFPPGEKATALTMSTGAGVGMPALVVRVRVAGFHTCRPVPPTASIPPPGRNARLLTGLPVIRAGTGRCQART